jgi:dephospho-CoA kinase
MPFKIAVTGGPATGKSTVLKRLARKGLPTFSADEVVRELTRPGTTLCSRIKETFGEAYFLPGGELDRRALLRLIVSDSKSRELLEEIIHPVVKKRLLAFFEAHQEAPVVAAEIPLLYEVGWEGLFDLVMVVYVPEEVQKRRLLERLGDPHLVEAFLQLQWPLEEKCRRADLLLLGDDPFSLFPRRLCSGAGTR